MSQTGAPIVEEIRVLINSDEYHHVVKNMNIKVWIFSTVLHYISHWSRSYRVSNYRLPFFNCAGA